MFRSRLLHISALAAVLFLASCDPKEKLPDVPDDPTPPDPVEEVITLSRGSLTLDGKFNGPEWPADDSYNLFKKDATKIVLSPKQDDASWDGSVVCFDFPSLQIAREGCVPVECATGVGLGSGKDISLSPVFGGFKLVFERDDVYGVTFHGGGNERLAGTIGINPETWQLEMRDNIIEMRFEPADGVLDPGKDWYVALPIVDLRSGFTLLVDALEGSYTLEYNEPFAIRASEFRTLNVPDGIEPPAPDCIPVPDANFKTYLLGLCDADSNGEISPEEALTVRSIEVTTDEIYSLEGIRYFTNLESLTANGYRASDRTIMGKLTELDLSGLEHLTSLSCRHNYITRIVFSGNTSLKSVVCYGNSLVELDLSGAPMLESIDAGDCQIATANVRENTFLSRLSIHNNRLTALDLSGNPNLTSLTCDRNLIPELDVSGCTRLTSLDCSPMNDSGGSNVLRKLLLSYGMSIAGITDSRNSTYIPDGTEIVYTDAPENPGLGTGLRSMYITTPDGAGITSKTVWKEGCTVKLVDDSGHVYYENTEVSVKGRGNSTWSYAKKPYALKLPEKADLIGTGSSKRWVLLANWMDRTLLRNDVAFELARRTSLEWTPNGEFIELFLNGKHIGNYWLGEKIKTEKSRLQADWIIEMDTYYDATWRFYSTYGRRANQGANGLPIGIKEPDDDEMNETRFAEIKALVNSAEEAIYVTRNYKDKIDVTSFIDWYLVHEVTYNGEPNHPKSCYFYFRDSKMYAGPCWDFDWYTFQPNTSGLFIPNSIYFGQLMMDREFVDALKARWEELRPKFLTTTAYIDQKAAEIRVSEAINWSMWPCSSSWVNGDERMSFDQSITRMKQALTSRITALDKAIANL